VIIAATPLKADSRRTAAILRGQFPQVRFQLNLGERRRKTERTIKPQVCRNLFEQLVDRPDADRCEHFPLLLRGIV
jgi:hypothetical protein